jgi:hypothetical protein
MKGSATRQRCTLAEAPPLVLDANVKCLTVMVFEKSGKTIIQPLVTSQETRAIQDLLQNDTLEVWLPNGKPDFAQFDVAILKYKQVMQPFTMCGRSKNRVCLKNYFETVVSCEQCPLSDEGAED